MSALRKQMEADMVLRGLAYHGPPPRKRFSST